MAGNPTIIVAETTGGDALQQGVVVEDPSAAHATAETHATTVEHKEVFPPFDPSSFSTQLIWLAITFAVLYFALSRVALPRIGGIIDARKQRIEGDLKEAERLRQETDKAVAAYEAALAEARKDAGKIAEETRESIRADIEGKRKVVESDLGARMSEAEASIQASKTTALGSVDAIAAETAQALVAQLGGGATEAEAHAAVAEAKGAV
ncbi:MAG: ATP F0F1 synthase subunit B [Devosia sp.]